MCQKLVRVCRIAPPVVVVAVTVDRAVVADAAAAERERRGGERGGVPVSTAGGSWHVKSGRLRPSPRIHHDTVPE